MRKATQRWRLFSKRDSGVCTCSQEISQITNSTLCFCWFARTLCFRVSGVNLLIKCPCFVREFISIDTLFGGVLLLQEAHLLSWHESRILAQRTKGVIPQAKRGHLNSPSTFPRSASANAPAAASEHHGVNISRVKNGNHQNRPQIIHPIASAARKPSAQKELACHKRYHAKRKSNICCHWYSPAALSETVPPLNAANISAGTTIPPSAAITGKAAFFAVESSPTSNSRLISSPTTKKKSPSDRHLSSGEEVLPLSYC